MNNSENFDRIARPYRWFEYLSFGPYLERCRFHFLSALADRRRALIFGDGDGRFTARLLQTNTAIHVEAVDASAAMIRLLEQRVARLGDDASSRLTARKADALQFIPCETYDLVATHFFLDCLSEHQIASLLAGTVPHLAPGAVWVVSEFDIPRSGAPRLLAKVVVTALYRAFRLLTGLRTHRLPGYRPLFERAGFSLVSRKSRLAGLLVSELWRFRG